MLFRFAVSFAAGVASVVAVNNAGGGSRESIFWVRSDYDARRQEKADRYPDYMAFWLLGLNGTIPRPLGSLMERKGGFVGTNFHREWHPLRGTYRFVGLINGSRAVLPADPLDIRSFFWFCNEDE